MTDKYVPPAPPSYGITSAPPEDARGYPPQVYAQPPGSFEPAPPQSYVATPAQYYSPTPPQNYGAHVAPPQLPPASVVVQPNGWYSRNQKNKPQSNAASAASLIFMSGGMNIAWAMGFRSIFWLALELHTIVAWFIGGIIGAVVSCILANRIPKKIVFCFAAILVIIGGVVRACTTYDGRATEASLYLDGIANGMVFAPTMALVGEVSVGYMRGSIAATTEHLSYIVGFFIKIVYMTFWKTTSYSGFNPDNLHGVVSAIFGLISLCAAIFLCIESPVILLANGQEQQAIDALRRLQRPYTISTETYEQLQEHKRYLAQNKDLSISQSFVQALPAFLRLVYLRALNAMSLSSLVFMALFFSILPTYLRNSYIWQYLVFGLCRSLGALITGFTMESGGRKKSTLLGLLVSGGMAIAVGVLLYDSYLLDFDTLFSLLCIFQLFAGVAFTATSVYLSEAYPLGVKQHFIAFTYIAEMLVFIIISSVDGKLASCANFFYTIGGLSLLGFILGIWLLPETRLTTLRESQEKFKGLLSKGF